MSRRQELEIFIKDRSRVGGALNYIRDLILKGLGAGTVVVRLGRVRRTLSQNKKLWPMLTDVAKQRQLVINGQPVWAMPEDWKDVFTASLRHEQRVALGIDGAPVFLGLHTSRMNKREFCDLIELIYAYGAEHRIRWSEKSLKHFDQYRDQQYRGVSHEPTPQRGALPDPRETQRNPGTERHHAQGQSGAPGAYRGAGGEVPGQWRHHTAAGPAGSHPA